MKSQIPIDEALRLWGEVQEHLPKCFKYYVCGSIRRNHSIVGDVDIVSDIDPTTLLSFLSPIKNQVEIVISGERKSRFLFKEIQFDFQHIKDPFEFGAAILYFTGSKDFNVRMRMVAKRKGMKLNEYGLWKWNQRIAVDETAILKLTGFERHISPLNREE